MERNGKGVALVTRIQRVGSGLNFDVHLHMLVLDGVYADLQAALAAVACACAGHDGAPAR